MPTKLLQPILLKIETHEQAVAVWHRLNVGTSYMAGYCHIKDLPWLSDIMDSEAHPTWKPLHEEMKLRGINPKEEPPEPPQPFKIGSHDTTFKPDGSIKVGCTDIDRATLVEVLKRSDEAMEGEWPKYWLHDDAKQVYKATSADCRGLYATGGRWDRCMSSQPFVEYVKRFEAYKPIPRAEASAILGRDV